MILDKLKSDSPNLTSYVIVFPRYNDSLEVEIEDVPVTRRYIFLPLTAKGHLRENVGTAVYAGSRQRSVRSIKGICTVVAIMAKVRAIPIMVAQARHVISEI